jgi:hypothetical protein
MTVAHAHMTARALVFRARPPKVAVANVAPHPDTEPSATTPAVDPISPTSLTFASIVTLIAAMTDTFKIWGKSPGFVAKPKMSAPGGARRALKAHPCKCSAVLEKCQKRRRTHTIVRRDYTQD